MSDICKGRSRPGMYSSVSESQSDASSVLLRSLRVGRGVLLHLPPLVVWDQHRPNHHDRSLHRPTRGQQLSHAVYSTTVRKTAHRL